MLDDAACALREREDDGVERLVPVQDEISADLDGVLHFAVAAEVVAEIGHLGDSDIVEILFDHHARGHALGGGWGGWKLRIHVVHVVHVEHVGWRRLLMVRLGWRSMRREPVAWVLGLKVIRRSPGTHRLGSGLNKTTGALLIEV